MPVEYEVVGKVGIVTIARPEARNAVDGEVARGIEAAVDRIEADPDVWVGILAGAPPVFCAGADLKAVAAGRAAESRTERGGFAGFVRRDRKKPFVAAVDGPALAGGCELALACDLIVASRHATFGLPEVKRSLVAAAGGLVRLPVALPRAVAMRMALTGEPISATEANRLGMVSELTDEGKALEGALDLAGAICQGAPLAVQATRQIILATEERGPSVGWELSAELQLALRDTEDWAEGPRAFIEKRSPVWVGR